MFSHVDTEGVLEYEIKYIYAFTISYILFSTYKQNGPDAPPSPGPPADRCQTP